MSEQKTCQKCHRRECRAIRADGGRSDYDGHILDCLQSQIDALKDGGLEVRWGPKYAIQQAYACTRCGRTWYGTKAMLLCHECAYEMAGVKQESRS